MKGLIIDTSSQIALLGIMDKDLVKEQIELVGKRDLNQTLFTKFSKLSKQVEFDFIAIGVGPGGPMGSYMGLRIGATLASTFAYAKKIPLIPFSSTTLFLPKNLQGPFTYLQKARKGKLLLTQGIVSSQKTLTLSNPQFLDEELFSKKETKNRLIDGRLEPSAPHLFWAAAYVTQGLSTQSDSLDQKPLSLQYID